MLFTPLNVRCTQRLLHGGYHPIALRHVTGVHDAQVMHATATDSKGNLVRLLYKEPACGAIPEWRMMQALPALFARFSPRYVAKFDDDPPAFIMEDGGVAYFADTKDRYSQAVGLYEQLISLHVTALDEVPVALDKHLVAQYVCDLSWCDRLLAPMTLPLPHPYEACAHPALGDMLATYRRYRPQTVMPMTITHGDVHPGNVLHQCGRIVFIDWEWCRIASPMRDFTTFLLQEDDESLHFALQQVAFGLLHASAYPATTAQMQHDWHVMMIENALAWAVWERKWYEEGKRTWEEATTTAQRQTKWMLHHFEQWQSLL